MPSAGALVATGYSKAVLRVAAEQLCRRPDIAYFPSYEVVTGAFARGRYFAEDLRSVTEAGVEHVMRLFFRHATDGVAPPPPPPAPEDDFLGRLKAAVETLCDEERLDP